MDGFILAGLFVLFGILFLIYKIFFVGGDVETTMEVQTEEDNPYLKQISEFRNTLLTHTEGSFAVIWGVNKDDIYLRTDSNDWNNHIITYIYRNQMARVYINWEKKIVKVSYSFRNTSYSFTKSKIFFIRHNTINYEKLVAWGDKMFWKSVKNGYPKLDDLAVECIERAKNTISSDADEKAYKKFLVDVWSNYVIHRNKVDRKIDAANFEKLSAYVMKYCGEELDEYIREQKAE